MNWQKIGMSAVPYLVSILISVALGVLAFRRWVAPDITAALEDATKTAQTLASLGGIKKADWNDGQKIEKAVAAELIYDKLPELQALKLILSESTWNEIEEMIEENPAAVIEMYEKYAPLLGKTSQKTEEYHY